MDQKPRIVVTGSRHWKDEARLRRELAKYLPAHDLHVGDAKGVDAMARAFAQEIGAHGKAYRAHWRPNGQLDRAAGVKRNARMLAEAKPSLVLAFRAPGVSNGTDHCVALAQKLGIAVRIIER